MKNILHSVSLRHDNTLKSLTKQALAQIIIKLIYLENIQGVNIRNLKNSLINATGVRFSDSDILDSLRWLMNTEHRVYQKNGKYYIKADYLGVIEKAIATSDELERNVINHWFGISATYKEQGGKEKIAIWFQQLLIEFFKDYSYDWIRDLMPKKGNGAKKTPNIERIIDKSLLLNISITEDHQWLKKKFVEFLESGRAEDNELLWNYGSSRFSATLLAARNYADEFSLEEFKNADFILDTNVLMILELEAYEQSHAIEALEKFFESQNISPKYFYISRDEYVRAIGPRKDATLAAFDKYNFNVFKETDCIFIKTALKRGSETREDLERFFSQIMDVPDKFGNSITLECEDTPELIKVISEAQEEEELKKGINLIYKRRTGNDKRETPIKHDAGLHRGVEFLRKTKRALILTRDSVLREYAYENAVRDELPLAIGIDSLIQMLALNSGGTENTSTNFAPLFSKLIQASLYPEKDMFKPEDLEYISHSHINIHDLPDENIMQIAKRINKLRYSGADDEEIQLEIRRLFQYDVNSLNDELIRIKSEEQRTKKDIGQKDSTISLLSSDLIESRTNERISKERKRVIFNWLKLVGSGVIVLILTYLLLDFSSIDNKWVSIGCSLGSDLLFTFIIYFFTFKGKLSYSKIKIRVAVEEEVKLKQLG
jgi:hypothetical protein